MSSNGTTNRVKVALRIRPPFEEEGSASAIGISQSSGPNGLPKSLQLEVSSGKKREFTFDGVFGPQCSNSDVYNVIGGPIVEGVLHGINGTILAYGQTGSGKTHSLGILKRLDSTSESGLIPRALSHIFGALGNMQAEAANTGNGKSYSVSLSFCQLYLDTVQDLLAPPTSNSNSNPPNVNSSISMNNSNHDVSMMSSNSSVSLQSSFFDPSGRRDSVTSSVSMASFSNSQVPTLGNNLNVREDPARGFYVEGLSEYIVRTFEEAISLLNWGLENRILGATRMNATSSRSHTILTVRLEMKSPAPSKNSSGFLTRKSQLMLCDLAGSERVRRTSSRGARLEEARAINASLHTLGQVIAALSVLSVGGPRIHVPWRDSKLTRLLYGALGGHCNTYLLATAGPAVADANETLSTLLFASRCMRVASIPVVAAAASQADFADLASKLHSKIAGLEAKHAAAIAENTRRYETTISNLQSVIEKLVAENAEKQNLEKKRDISDKVLTYKVNLSLLGEDANLESSNILATSLMSTIRVFDNTIAMLLSHLLASHASNSSWGRAISRAKAEEDASDSSTKLMHLHDPMKPHLQGETVVGSSHSASQSLSSIHMQHSDLFGPNGSSIIPKLPHGASFTSLSMAIIRGDIVTDSSSKSDMNGKVTLEDSLAAVQNTLSSSLSGSALVNHINFEASSPEDIVTYLSDLVEASSANSMQLENFIRTKDSRFEDLKRHLASVEASLRVREEDASNHRAIVKYMVKHIETLQGQLHQLQPKASTHQVSDSVGSSRSDSLYDSGLSPVRTFHGSNDFDVSEDLSEENLLNIQVDSLEADARPLSKMWQRRETVTSAVQGGSSVESIGGKPPRAPPSHSSIPAKVPVESGDMNLVSGDTIEAIVGARVKGEAVLYQVHWSGSTSADDEWFYREDLLADFPEVVAKYEAKLHK
jgi:Kinesin motor domain